MGGAKCLLDNGLNPWLYMFAREVHDYNNPDSKNMKGFVGYLKKKFGTIEALNSAWRTSFKDFNDILVEKPGPSSLVKGMWFDWRLYMGKEFAEQIKWIKDRFREVDQRKNTYIGFMNAVWALKNQYNSIIDIYETAKVTDFYSLEGGVNFGEQPKSLDKISTNQLTAIFRLRGRFNSQLFHDIGRAIFPRKPIFNVETYTERTHKGMEVKIKKSDIITNLWNEVIHGSSGANFYGWRSVSGIDTKEKAMGNSFPSLLNPYKTPPEALDGFKKFNSEIGPIKNILLPRPRIEGEIALLISRVSRWNGVRTDQSKGLYYNYYQKIITAYGGLMQTHYPLDVLYEADLASKGDDYKAIVIPGYSYMFAGTYPKLKKYVGNGGTLVILGDAYKYDEYGRDMNISKLTGVRIKDDFVTEKKEIQLFDFSHCYEDISITTSARIKPLTSRVIGTDSSDAPFATKNSYGKGTVYYIAGDSIGVDAQYELFARILKDAGVRKDFKVVDDKGKAFDDVEAQVIDRGKNRIYYIVDWQNFSVRKGYLKITEPYKKTYIYDVIRQAYIADTSGNIKWSKKSLIDRGFPIAMEGQVRNVFLVSSKPVMKQEKIIGPDDINRNVNSLKQKVKEQKKDFDDFVRMVKPYR
jgi:hypothetical protein